MGIATDLREAGYLQPLSSGVRRYIDKKRKEAAQERLLKGLSDFELKNANLERFNPRTQQYDVLQENPANADPFQFEKNTARDRSDFIEGIIPDLANFDPGQLNLAMDNIESLAQANRPLEQEFTPQMKYKTIGDKTFEVGQTGEIDFTKPVYTTKKDEKPKERLIFEDSRERVYGYPSEDGNREIDGVNYLVTRETDKRKETGKDEDTQPDYSKLIGEVNEGISKINALNESVMEDEEGHLVSYTFEDKKYEDNFDNDFTWDQYKSFKEGIKNKYKQPAIQMINQQGLDEAVEDVRQLIKTEGSLQKALSKFKELNEDDFNDEDLRILLDYFRLMSL